MKNPECPICGSPKSRILYSLSSHEVAAYFLPQNSPKREKIVEIIEKIWEGKHVDFLTCKKCSFGFANPFKAGTSEFYSELYYAEFEYPKQKWEYNITLESIETLLKDKHEATLIEIGAGNGIFINNLVEKKIIDKANIYATEFSESAKSSIQSKGIFCMNSSVVQLKDNEKLPLFDIICMFQVLEHLDDIDAVFQSLNSISTPSANLFISVPNSNLRHFLDKFGVLYDIPPMHIGKYSLESIWFICQKYNWNVASYAYESVNYTTKAKKLLFERYWSSKFSGKIESSATKLGKKLLRYTFMSWILIRYFTIFIYLIRKESGTSFWIHLKKTP